MISPEKLPSDIDCSKNPCKNGGTCIDTFQGYKCKCIPGYNGTNCEISKFKALFVALPWKLVTLDPVYLGISGYCPIRFLIAVRVLQRSLQAGERAHWAWEMLNNLEGGRQYIYDNVYFSYSSIIFFHVEAIKIEHMV